MSFTKELSFSEDKQETYRTQVEMSLYELTELSSVSDEVESGQLDRIERKIDLLIQSSKNC